MGLLEILKGLLVETKVIEVKKLPSQGLFYKEDFSIKIKKAEIEDIIAYEYNYIENNIISALECIKMVVNRNVVLPDPYSYKDIKSVDIIFIFLEIVKFTTSKEIKIPYVNRLGIEEYINFDIDHFNYFKFDNYMKNYNSETREMILDGYRFSLPSIGVETSLTHYLSTKSEKKEIENLNKVSYDFMFFLGGKNKLEFSEIDNLIQIFNYDLDDVEILKVRKIVEKFKGIVGYSLVIDGDPIEIKTKINLQDIWKI